MQLAAHVFQELCGDSEWTRAGGIRGRPGVTSLQETAQPLGEGGHGVGGTGLGESSGQTGRCSETSL